MCCSLDWKIKSTVKEGNSNLLCVDVHIHNVYKITQNWAWFKEFIFLLPFGELGTLALLITLSYVWLITLLYLQVSNRKHYLGCGKIVCLFKIIAVSQADVLSLYFSLTVKEGEELTSPCLSLNYQGEWEHAKILYKIKGQKPGTWSLLYFCKWVFWIEIVTTSAHILPLNRGVYIQYSAHMHQFYQFFAVTLMSKNDSRRLTHKPV